MEAQKINIHTSLPVGELIELGVNCLVIGHIPLPGQFAAKRADVAHIPYVHVRDEENVTGDGRKKRQKVSEIQVQFWPETQSYNFYNFKKFRIGIF